MSVGSDLAALAESVAAGLAQSRAQGLRPPAGLPERAVVWLALAPAWTGRMAASCGFPAEAVMSERTVRRREEQASQSESAVAARHALGVLALKDGQLRKAEEHFTSAVNGFSRLGISSGLVAAYYHLGEVASRRGDVGESQRWLGLARDSGSGWADDVCDAVVARRLAESPGLTPAEGAGSLITLREGLGPLTLEACRVLERLGRQGLCDPAVGEAPESATSIGTRLTERRYVMADQLREEVIQPIIRDPKRGIREVQTELRLIAERVLAAEADGVPMLRGVLRWATLAALAEDVKSMAGLLSRECSLLLRPDQADDGQSGVVLAWIQAAKPLEALLEGELSVALSRARRQLDLYHRRRDDDQRYLLHFLKRAEQMSAVDELLADDDAWALHFIGAAGTGKTMLMRYISSVRGPELHAATARIDFDYLSPSYPDSKPGLLLSELAEELRLSADGEAISLFGIFDEELQKLHEEGTRDGEGAPASMDAVTGAFIDALRAMDRRVILLIDTCEELAKVRADGVSPEGVTKTFEILERLRDGDGDGVPGLQVIFAGQAPAGEHRIRLETAL